MEAGESPWRGEDDRAGTERLARLIPVMLAR
jgi:hypothetical protein